LMSNIDGLFVIGEANFSDHGANRLGASALMQGLADGYFVLPYTLNNYLGQRKPMTLPTDHPEFKKVEEEVRAQIAQFLSIRGKKTPIEFHRESGKLLWENCGMARTRHSLTTAIARFQELQEEFRTNVNVPGAGDNPNQSLERAGRVADFLEFGELTCRDALTREESCGGHFREEYQTSEGEAKRNDADFMHVAAWEYAGKDREPIRNREALVYEEVHLAERSYK